MIHSMYLLSDFDYCFYQQMFLFSFQPVSDAMLAELKQCFMEAYDDNRDGKIDIREVSTIGSFKLILM